jgi:UDP-N-acetylmuramate--alanine ligase
MKIELAKNENIHFVGIGGIGMSGLALIMKGMGFKIQGSDISNNKNIERLKKNRIKILIGHSKKNITNATILVISSAIKKNNSEVQQAKIKNLPIYKRGDMLAHITSLTQNIVVAGSHGKTTTTSLISGIFSKAKLDPTIINGGVINSLQSSARLGKSKWCVLESDESDGSFIKVPPTYSIVTNVDREHMDYYKSMDKLKNHFLEFINKVPSFGKSFICIDDKVNNELIRKIKTKNFYTYGINKNSNFRIKNIRQHKELSIFDIEILLPAKQKTIIKDLNIPLLGLHNIRNATAAVAVGFTIGISKKIIKESLRKFEGVQRRFNKIFSYRGVNFFDDYAHHPTEIKELIEGVDKVYKKEKIFCVFQPHRISRLKDLRNEFSLSFKKAEGVILCPIYKAGERIKLGFNYLNFAKEISKKSDVKVYLVKDQYQLSKFVKQHIYGNKVVIGMGAGSISSWMKELPKLL